MLMHRLGSRLVRGASLLATLALFAGLPTALAWVAGWPLPRRIPAGWAGWAHLLTGGFPDTAVIDLLAIGLWLLWAAFCYSLAGEIVATRRGRPARQVRAISPLQTLAALLIAGMSAGPAAAASASLVAPPAVVTTVAAPVTAVTTTARPLPGGQQVAPTTMPPWASAASAGQLDSPVTATLPFRPAATATTTAATGQAPRFALVARTGPLTVAANGRHYTVTVHHHDTLWDLARTWLGDPHRWPEIYHLNADRYDQHGRMRGGNHIETDWVLVLPGDATPPPGAHPAHSPHQQAGGPRQPGRGQPTAGAPSTTSPSSPTVAPSTAPVTSTPAATDPTTTPTGTPSETADSDGVADPPLAGPSGPTAAPTSAASSIRSQHPTRHPSAVAKQPRGVALPSGSWLDLGLAAAIVAAVALLWAHRRHRYTRRPPSPDLRLTDPDVAPMPPVVRQIRRRLHQASHQGISQHGSADAVPPVRFGPDAFDDDQLLPAGDRRTDPGLAFGAADAGSPPDREYDEDEAEDEGEDDEDDGVEGAAEPLLSSTAGKDGRTDQPSAAASPVVPSLAHPLAAVWPPAGLGLNGPGAEAAARGFLAAALAAGGLDEPDQRSWVVMPAVTAATLLGAAAVTPPGTPRLTVTSGLDEALDLLEAHALHRSRIVYAHEVDTVAEVRAVDSTEEPLAPMMLLADATTRHQRTRIAALLAQGQRLDIHGVLLGPWPDGNTVVVAADGTTSPAAGERARHGHHPADIGRLATLTPAETADLLITLAESHTGQPPRTAPTERPPTAAAPDTGTARAALSAPTPQTPRGPAASTPEPAQSALPEDAPSPPDAPTGASGSAILGSDASRAGGDTTSDGGAAELSSPVVAPGGASAGAAADTPVDTQAAARLGAGTEADDEEPAEADLDAEEPDLDGEDTDTGTGRVEVTVLGAAGIVDAPAGWTLRKRSLEVLVYLAVHDGDASAEAILDDVMPDAPANKAPRRLYTYISNLRTVMRHTGGRGTYITHPRQRYVLNRDIIDIDLWRMRDAIRDADRATDAQQRIAALRRAVDTYGGHLAEDADYEWIEPYRQAVRTQALDAYLALAEALADSPAEQVTILETAIRHNPYVEELYQLAMRARAALGHLDAVRTLRRSLTRALGEIDAEPNDTSIALADELIAHVQRPGRRPDLRAAPRPSNGAAA